MYGPSEYINFDLRKGLGREEVNFKIILFLRQVPVWGRKVTHLYFSKLSFLEKEVSIHIYNRSFLFLVNVK